MTATQSLKKAIAIASMTLPLGAWAAPVTTNLFYTTFAGVPNVWKAAFAYDGSGTAAGVSYASTAIASTNGADGIVFNPNNGHLLVGGQGPQIHDVPTSGVGISSQSTPGVNDFHLAIDPTQNFVYGSGIPGAVAKVGINAGGFTGSVTNMTISGSTNVITSLAFDAAGTTAFYTTASPTSFGQFGVAVVGASTISTTLTQTLTAAHGMIFDTFTGWLTLFGETDIVQIDPSNPTAAIAGRTMTGVDFDQGTSDGLGHIWVASNNGNVTFIDLTSCTGGKVNASNCFIDTRFLANALDDLAPLAGLGGCAPNCPVLEPGTLPLAMPALAALLLAGRRRRWGQTPSAHD